MDEVTKILTQHSSQILLILLIIATVLAIFVWRLASQQSRMHQRWKTLLIGTTGENLEKLLYDHLRERLRMEEEIEALKSRAKDLEKRLAENKGHLGLVRFDAFDDVSGNQSFALALYDDQGNGAVLNSIVGRTDCRVYCKPLLNGRSERDLSQEEQRAIREATSTAPKTIISS